jgi:anion-transporting  ArsA/GET3 family ATPase
VSADPGLAAVDDVLATAEVIVMAGPGGVGKTTVAASLGLRAAQHHQRRVVVVTVDPARRLAEALGVARLTEEPVLVPVGEGRGRLWVLMVDMAKSWDELVRSNAPDPSVSDRLLHNGLYRTLTRRFVQSHDYIALDHLVGLADRDRYDLVIVDTPPSGHALDLLDAPGRMIEFFESRLLRWLTAGAGSSLGAVAAKPFLLVAERLLGHDFLAQISEFFTLFAKLRPAFVARAKVVEQRLSDGGTSYVAVTTTSPPVVAGTQDLIDELQRRRLSPGLLVVNRLAPTLRLIGPGPGASAGDRVRLDRRINSQDLDVVQDPNLAAAVAELLEGADIADLPVLVEPCPVVAVDWSPDDLTDLSRLAALFTKD